MFYEAIRPLIPAGSIIRSEKPLSLEQSEPEPDISVVEGPLARYASTNPSTALVIVEISLTSLQYDREKSAIYARAGVPVYLIVNVEEKTVELHSEPAGPSYQSLRTYSRDQSLPLFDSALDLTQIFTN